MDRINFIVQNKGAPCSAGRHIGLHYCGRNSITTYLE